MCPPFVYHNVWPATKFQVIIGSLVKVIESPVQVQSLAAFDRSACMLVAARNATLNNFFHGDASILNIPQGSLSDRAQRLLQAACLGCLALPFVGVLTRRAARLATAIWQGGAADAA